MPLSLKKKLLTLMSGSLAQQYTNDVLATSPIAYWKLNEGSGSTITDSSGNDYDGSYTGVTWDGTQSPVNEPVPYWDGTNDTGDVDSAGLDSAFDYDEFTILLWFKVADASIWTDGSNHYLFNFQRDVSNLVRVAKPVVDNTLFLNRIGDGTSKLSNISSQSDTDWVSLAISCSIGGGGLLNAGDLRFYKNGSQLGSTVTGNVAATGSNIATTVIGAQTTAPANVWDGYMSQFVVYNRPMDNDILALMTV